MGSFIFDITDLHLHKQNVSFGYTFFIKDITFTLCVFYNLYLKKHSFSNIFGRQGVDHPTFFGHVWKRKGFFQASHLIIHKFSRR